jgi:hypothetical protein
MDVFRLVSILGAQNWSVKWTAVNGTGISGVEVFFSFGIQEKIKVHASKSIDRRFI